MKCHTLQLLYGPEELDLLQVPVAMELPAFIVVASKVRPKLLIHYRRAPECGATAYTYNGHEAKP